MRQIVLTTWVAVAAAGCNFDSGGMTAPATDSTAAPGDTEATAGATDDEGTSTTVGATGSATGPTTEVAVSYCHGFQVAAEAPFLSLYIVGGEVLTDGAAWPIECDEGRWMFGLYPSLGGWDPHSSQVKFTVEVDVEGYDPGDAGHFFSDEVDYHIGCEDPWAGLIGVAPVYLPEGVSDPAQLDGKPAEVRVTVLAGDMELRAEASVTLSAPRDVLLQGCTSP
ncbi:hypothetical protein SAMN02745121_01041 [Nannocystis exedens]|uniref:Uncharacterized protein n=1 Tax=Nannocystis exedens TaxID=54 RepID=A0A1I1U7S4_9BACT|nr:hypothetical protein [Nannocystis exedens]SFD66921.1 hypothetical protein SAMN02745121_01041 [Nannocystis exedens]